MNKKLKVYGLGTGILGLLLLSFTVPNPVNLANQNVVLNNDFFTIYSDYTEDDFNFWEFSRVRIPKSTFLRDTLEIRSDNGNDFLYMMAELPGEGSITFTGQFNQFYFAQDHGAIGWIDYEEDFILFNQPDSSFRVMVYPALSQMHPTEIGQLGIFIPEVALTITDTVWTTYSLNGLTAQNFINIHNAGNEPWPHPDFSGKAPLIFFGFVRIIERLDEFDWTEQEYPAYTAASDNYKITVYPETDDDSGKYVIRDGTYDLTNWEVSVVRATHENNTLFFEQKKSGGNSGPYLYIRNELVPANPGGITAYFKYTGDYYDPAEYGPATYITHSEDLLRFEDPEVFRVTSTPMIWQGDYIFESVIGVHSNNFAGWSRGSKNMVYTDFRNVTQQEPLYPDFSENGDRIYFGFARGITTSVSEQGLIYEHGSDNFTVNMHDDLNPVLNVDYHVLRTDEETDPSLIGYPPFMVDVLANDTHPLEFTLVVDGTSPGPDTVSISNDQSYVIVNNVSALDRYSIYNIVDIPYFTYSADVIGSEALQKENDSGPSANDEISCSGSSCTAWILPDYLIFLIGRLFEQSTPASDEITNTNQQEIELFYRFRDEILENSEFGGQFVNLFYSMPEIVKILVFDRPDLSSTVIQMMRGAIFQSLISGHEAVIGEPEINFFNNFITELKESGSITLQGVMEEELELIGPLEGYIGMTVKEAAGKIIGQPISTHVQEKEDFPLVYQLQQNYPNPFNPSTTIRYSIGDPEFVTLTVYDITGRRVATLVREEKSPGVYEARFDARNLASGVFYYTIKAGLYSETMKMVLLK